MSYEDYLAYNKRSNSKLEFLNGIVYAMAGGTRAHSWIASNLIAILNPKLKGKKCYTLTSDTMVETPSREAVYFPDVSIYCGEKPGVVLPPLTDPILVVEVLSASTRKYDLSTKLEHYKLIPALRHILYVDSESIGAQLYTRREDEVWPGFPETFTALRDTIEFRELNLSIPMAEMYDQLAF